MTTSFCVMRGYGARPKLKISHTTTPNDLVPPQAHQTKKINKLAGKEKR
jgi:hypothetical protein